jgi:hypothetical protein
MVGAVLALPATGPEPAQADNIAIQIRLGIKRWNFIWRSLSEIKRHYWRPVSPKNCVVSTSVFPAIALRRRGGLRSLSAGSRRSPLNDAVDLFTEGNPTYGCRPFPFPFVFLAYLLVTGWMRRRRRTRRFARNGRHAQTAAHP